MSTDTIEVRTPRGTMPVHVHRPDDAWAPAIVVLFMDAPGIRPALHEHAERLVGAGYTAVLPDLYYPFDPAERPNADLLKAGDPEEFKRMQGLVARVPDDDVLEDTTLMLEALPERATSPWGCVGFCRPAYNREAAERAWAGTLELLRERL